MHESVMEFLRTKIVPSSEIEGKYVLEVGSRNVNGTPRSVIEPMKPAKYVGVDLMQGPGVDVVLDAGDLVRHFGRESFDVVISTEMLEHTLDWRRAIQAMKGVLRPGGLVVITTRGPGFPYHEHPYDYWRFTVQDFLRIFADFQILELMDDPGAPGVFLKARKPRAVCLDEIEVAKAQSR